MRLDDHALDTTKLDEGVWWDFHTKEPCRDNKPHDSHGCFLIVPVIGSKFSTVVAEMWLPYAELARKKPSAAETEAHQTALEAAVATVQAKAIARCILKGWANWEAADGSPLVYSEAKAADILAERRFLALRQFIESAAANNAAALAREEQQAQGN